MSSPLALLLATLVAGPVTLLPPPDQTQVVTLFRPGVTEQEVFVAIMAVNGRILGLDPSGQLWVIDVADGGNPAHLYRYGAVMISSLLIPLGCFDWTRA